MGGVGPVVAELELPILELPGVFTLVFFIMLHLHNRVNIYLCKNTEYDKYKNEIISNK
jgi:hypothetical protein